MEQTVAHKWEFLVEEATNIDTLKAQLSRRGTEGWELVNVVQGQDFDSSAPVKTLRTRRSGILYAFLKRPNEG